MTKKHSDPEYHRNARKVRAILQPTINAGGQVACVDCGRAVQPGQRWDVAHKLDASRGGTHALSNLGASHRRCNRSAGGRLGAIATHTASRRAKRLPAW